MRSYSPITARILTYGGLQNSLKLFLPPILLIFLAIPAFTQDEEDDTDLQLWNDLEITIPVNKKLDIDTETTLRLEDNISRVDSVRFGFGVTYKPTESFSLSPYNTFISSRSSSGDYRFEYRAGLDAVYKFPVKGFGLSHRSRIEHRWRPGNNSWRYRPSITIEKELPENFLKDAKVFLTEEPFYDSSSGRFSRNRISAGVEKQVNKKFAVEFYYLFQGDNSSSPGSVHVLGTGWKVSL